MNGTRLKVLQPDDPVRCDFFDATLPAAVCLARQRARWPGGNRWGDGSVRARKAAIFGFCGSGLCAQGAGYAARTVYDPSADWSRGRYKFFRPDAGEQRRRRREWIRERAEEVPTIDTPPGGVKRAPPLDLADPEVLELLGGLPEPCELPWAPST
jgi:hypothetical protein